MPPKRMPRTVYRAVFERAEDMTAWPGCEALIAGKCSGMAHHWHHRQLRSQGGEHVVVNGLAICSDCHTYIHGHPAESYRNGWIVHGFDYPEDEPVLRRGRWVLLHEDGTMTEVERDQSDTGAEAGG